MLQTLDDVTRGDPETQSNDELVTGPARGALICVQCRRRITREDFVIAEDGQSEHTRTNPHGFTFTFRLFALAPGCATRGLATTADSWFPPQAWQFAHCSGCGQHLGWCFTRAASARCYALINDRLRQDDLS